jgi:hypothetical protein
MPVSASTSFTGGFGFAGAVDGSDAGDVALAEPDAGVVAAADVGDAGAVVAEDGDSESGIVIVPELEQPVSVTAIPTATRVAAMPGLTDFTVLPPLEICVIRPLPRLAGRAGCQNRCDLTH